jgi:hypothetical protein
MCIEIGGPWLCSQHGGACLGLTEFSVIHYVDMRDFLSIGGFSGLDVRRSDDENQESETHSWKLELDLMVVALLFSIQNTICYGRCCCRQMKGLLTLSNKSRPGLFVRIKNVSLAWWNCLNVVGLHLNLKHEPLWLLLSTRLALDSPLFWKDDGRWTSWCRSTKKKGKIFIYSVS